MTGHRDGGFITCYGSQCATGFFESENYPNPYPNRWDATYQLYIPAAVRIDFEFVGSGGFGIESHKDELYVGTGLLFTQDTIIASTESVNSFGDIVVRFFDNRTITSLQIYPPPFSFLTDTVWLYFRTDKSDRFNGWRLQWTAIGMY